MTHSMSSAAVVCFSQLCVPARRRHRWIRGEVEGLAGPGMEDAVDAADAAELRPGDKLAYRSGIRGRVAALEAATVVTSV